MSKKHLKSLAAPKTWEIKRKNNVFTTRPNPGRSLELSMPINLILRDMLHYAHTTKEVKKVLNSGKIFVNGKSVKDFKFPVGIMDYIEIPELKQIFLFYIGSKGKFMIKSMKDKIETYKIIGKTLLKNKKLQLNCLGGKNIIVDKDSYKVGDSIVLDKTKIKKHLKFEEGASVYLYGGKYIGYIGILEKIHDVHNKHFIFVKVKNEKVETLKNYAFVIESNLIGDKE